MSTRETVLAAVASALTGIASGRVYRGRREQLPTLPAVIIEPLAASSAENVLGMTDHELTVGISVFAKGEIPDTAADATLSAIHTALMADLTLGLGSEVQLAPGIEVDWNYDDFDYVRAEQRYRISYRTATGAF